MKLVTCLFVILITCYCSLGNVYMSDSSNHRIRKVAASTGIITTIAGTGSTSFSGDNGAATSATLNSPHGVTVDASGNCVLFIICVFVMLNTCHFSLGNVYIADQSNNRIRKIALASTYSYNPR